MLPKQVAQNAVARVAASHRSEPSPRSVEDKKSISCYYVFLSSCIPPPCPPKMYCFFTSARGRDVKPLRPRAPQKTMLSGSIFFLKAPGQKSKPVQHCISGGWGRRGCVKKQYLLLDTRVRLIDRVAYIRKHIRTYTYTYTCTYTCTYTYTCTHIETARREEAEPMCFCGMCQKTIPFFGHPCPIDGSRGIHT